MRLSLRYNEECKVRREKECNRGHGFNGKHVRVVYGTCSIFLEVFIKFSSLVVALMKMCSL